MASFTPYLDLLKKSPITDGDDTFNVDTMLNENWDKIDTALGDTTTPAKKLGLTGDLSVGASLGVLATVGDLYVWRRTVTAHYVVSSVVESLQLSMSDTCNVSDSISLDSQGNIRLTNATEYRVSVLGTDKVRGKFVQAESDVDKTYFVQNDAVLSSSGSAYIVIDKTSTVSAVDALTDYPVSVNPNAYQAGSDAQPAGYTLGEVQNGSFKFTTNSNNYIIAGDGVNVSQGGSVSLSNNTLYTTQSPYQGDDGAQTLQSRIVGKFFYLQDSESEEFNTKQIYYVPFDATVTWNSSSGGFTELSKYQTVNGYPAIPAGTTIEALGKLGDKARIEVGSYVGTGTSIASIPIKKSAKMVIVTDESGYKLIAIKPAKKGTGYWSNTSSAFCTLSWSDSGLSIDGKQPNYAMNSSGSTYYYCVFY